MSRDRPESSSSAFHPALVRKLVSVHLEEEQHQQEQNGNSNTAPEATARKATSQQPLVTAEAAEAVGELLKQFVLEARNRAALQAEIEQGVSAEDGDAVVIRSDHITRISAEMFMDFS